MSPEKTKKTSPAARPDPEPGWIDAGKGYALALREGKLVCRNARGQVLASVPRAVRDGEAGERLAAAVEWLETHARECADTVETWMLRALPAPRRVLEEAWEDPWWRAALHNAVVVPAGAKGEAAPGFFRGVDRDRGLGAVNLDGETVWTDAPSVVFVHPIALADLDDFRSMAVELSLGQGIHQLFRETFRKPADLDPGATSVGDFRGARFAQLNHALGLCRRLGYRVAGGSAVTRVWEDGRACEARFWVGAGDPMDDTTTDALEWVEARGRALAVAEVGPVAFSEGMRMASAIHAGRVVPEEGEGG